MLYIENSPKVLECFSDNKIEISIHDMICKEDTSGEEAYYLLENRERDYDRPIFDDIYRCVDLDQLECIRRKYRKGGKQNNPSMDMAFFIEEKTNRFTVLVEFRLNYKILKNIRKVDLDSKVQCSSRCSRHFFKLPVYPQKYFVFPSKKLPEFKNRLRRMNPQCSPNYIAVDVPALYSKFFDQRARA